MGQMQSGSTRPPDAFEPRREIAPPAPRTQTAGLNPYRDIPLLGRERERQRVYDAARPGLRSLICGPPGIGKTRLLLRLKAELDAEGRDVLYVRFAQPMHQLLLSFAAAIDSKKHAIPIGQTSVNLKGILWKIFEERPRVILLDKIASAGPHTYRFFERIIAVPGISLLGAAMSQNSLGPYNASSGIHGRDLAEAPTSLRCRAPYDARYPNIPSRYH